MKPSIFRRGQSAGIAIVTAIFLLVVVAGLVVAIVSLTTTQQDASAKDLQGTRAYLAARSGIEWALYQALQTQQPPQPSTALGCNPTSPPPVNITVPGATLSAFRVTVRVTCDQGVSGIAGGGPNDATAFHVFIESTACSQPGADGFCPNAAPGPDYVQRRVTAQL
ncbi:MSHA biogenesis protein MshP [Duganella sp. 1224]|uniref:agglutinin biogenesis protein MshP n=1 Tax=Duganella sp. 1224 TaxID=2587052 RepID=UPI0015CC1077|nr:agglutinin biogenesis protein MshP [Duganella sp. 1224]NYE60457.1 MSHA biogenesis protein MshP [Duganella sp. 1224]